jgi:hypothetical protein
MVSPLGKRPVGHRDTALVRQRLTQADDMLRITERQRFHHDAVDNAEDNSAGTNAQAKVSTITKVMPEFLNSMRTP